MSDFTWWDFENFVGAMLVCIGAITVAGILLLLGIGPQKRGHDPEDQHESPPIHKGDYR